MAEYISEHTGAEIDAGIRPYKVYTALLSQTGTNAPVATILENTIGDIIWLRNQAGIYNANIGAFPYAKIFCNYFGGSDYNNTNYTQVITLFDAGDVIHIGTIRIFQTGTYINVQTVEYPSEEDKDNLLINFPIEIRVYP